jgi:hypothetical protein
MQTYFVPSLRLISAKSAASALSETSFRSAEFWREHLLRLSEEDLTLVVASLVDRSLLTPVIVTLLIEISKDRQHKHLGLFLAELDVARGIVVTGATTCRG